MSSVVDKPFSQSTFLFLRRRDMKLSIRIFLVKSRCTSIHLWIWNAIKMINQQNSKCWINWSPHIELIEDRENQKVYIDKTHQGIFLQITYVCKVKVISKPKINWCACFILSAFDVQFEIPSVPESAGAVMLLAPRWWILLWIYLLLQQAQWCCTQSPRTWG